MNKISITHIGWILAIFFCYSSAAQTIETQKYTRQWKLAIEPQFDDLKGWPFGNSYAFSEGLARVSIQNKQGFINKEGKFVINPIYDNATDFKNGAAIACIDKKCAVINSKGSNLTNFVFDEPISLYAFSEGIAIVSIKGKEHYIDNKGNLILPNSYRQLGSFHNGYAAVGKEDETDLNMHYGVIDKNGELVIDFIYDSMPIFSDGLAVFESKNKHGYLDKSGAIVISPQFADAYPFRNGIAAIAVGDDCNRALKSTCKYGFINKSGEIVINPKYDFATRFNDGLAYATLDKKIGYINIKGETVIPFQFDNASDFINGYARVAIKNKNGLIDTNGNIVIPLIFDDISLPAENMVGVKIKGKWGFIKLDSIKPQYL